MKSLRFPLLIGLFSFILYLSITTEYPPTPVSGHADPGYERLHDLFKNISETERGGVAMVLMKRGEIVADLWAGYADPSANQSWKKDTLAVAFSTTKVFIGILFTRLKRDHRFSYSDKVSTIWPEFACNGKEDTTVSDILDHKAGLLRFSRDFSLEESRNTSLMARIIEQTTPQWQPGTKMGYSGLAYGYVIDQLVIRLDKKGRTAADYFNEEIRSKSKDQDFFLGLPEDDNYRVARVTNPSLLASSIAHLSHPLNYLNILYNFFKNDMLAESSAKYPSFLDLMRPDVVPYNSPDVRSLPLISVNGIGTARAMAHTLIAAARLLTDEERVDLMTPIGEEEDFVLSQKKFYGRGLSYLRHPTQENASRFIISFWGNGLQSVSWDPIDDVVLVVFRNGLMAGDNGRKQMNELLAEAFR